MKTKLWGLRIFLVLCMCYNSIKADSVIVTTFSVLESMILRLIDGVDSVNVISLVPNGSDPHIFQPKPSLAKQIQSANLVVLNGLGLEEWMDRFVTSAKSNSTLVINATDGLPPRILHQATHPVYDPHMWHNVKAAQTYVKNIKNALIKVFPDKSLRIEKNYTRYVEELKMLHEWIERQWKNVLKNERFIVTTHDAFAYYGALYGVIFFSPLGASTEEQPTPRKIADLIQKLKKNKVKTFFLENLASDRLLKQVALEAGLTCKGSLYADSLLPYSPKADAYVHTMRHNTLQLIGALKR